MFDVILTACLLSGQICAERLVPAAIPDRTECIEQAPERARQWADAHALTVSDPRCVAWDDLPAQHQALEVKEIADGVFVHQGGYGVPDASNGGDLANLGFIIGDDAVAVVDSGTTRAVAERLYAAIRAKTALPIRYLLLTHMHPDHALGAAFFKEAGAEVIGHPNLARGLANRAESYERALERLIGAEGFIGTRLIAPDEAVTDARLSLGGRELRVEAHALAHTDNDLTVLDEQTGIWFMGDLVFAEHTPALDGSILGWQQLMQELDQREVRGIVPGHGPAPLPWPDGAEPMRKYLAAITTEAREAIAKGLPMSAAVRTIGESQRAHWRLFDEFNIRNATAAFKELEWE